jgi:hypothetical protein
MARALDSVRRWYNNLFRKSVNVKVEIIPEPTPEISVAKTPGLSCPVCSHRIILITENLRSCHAMSLLWAGINR